MIITIGYDDKTLGTLDEDLTATGDEQAIHRLAARYMAKGLEGKELLEAIVNSSNGRFWAEKAKRVKVAPGENSDQEPDEQAADESQEAPLSGDAASNVE